MGAISMPLSHTACRRNSTWWAEWGERSDITSSWHGIWGAFIFILAPMAKGLLHNKLTPLDVHGEGKAGWRTGLWAETESRWGQHLPAWGDWSPRAVHCESQNQSQVRVQGYTSVPQTYAVGWAWVIAVIEQTTGTVSIFRAETPS